MYNKTIIEFGLCDIGNNQGLGKCNQPAYCKCKCYCNIGAVSGVTVGVLNKVPLCKRINK